MRTVTIDEGWAWGVPIGGFIANFIVGGLAKSFGIIMISTQELLNADVAPLTLAGGLIYAFMYCLSLLSIFLSEKYGCLKVVCLGATGCVISFICAFFAQSVTMWVCAIGGGVGISLAFIYSILFVMVGRCFRRYVGVAMGLSVAGVSVGQILFPTIISFIIDTYGARGSYLVGAGIVCNFFITAVLMPNKIIDPEQSATTKKELENAQSNSNNHKKDIPEEIPLREKEMTTQTNQISGNQEEIRPKKKKNKNPFSTIERFHGVMLVIFISAKIFGDIGDVGVAFALPLFGEHELGLENNVIGWAIAGAGVVDLVTRLFIGVISDKPWCRRSLLLLVAWLIESINTCCFIWFPNIWAYFIFYGVFGACSGTAITLMTVVITDLVGQKNLPIGFALMMFCVGLVICVGQFLVGFIADKTGSYNWSMYFLGLNLILSFLLLALEYPVKYFCFHTTEAVADNMKAKSLIHSVKLNENGGDIENPTELDKLKMNGDYDYPQHNPRSRLSSGSTLCNELRELVMPDS